MDKQYLGDGVYVEYDKRTQQVILTTGNDVIGTNIIYLDPCVLVALVQLVERLREEK